MMKTLFVQRKERQKEFFLDEEHALIFKNNKREKLHFSKLHKIKWVLLIMETESCDDSNRKDNEV